MAYKTLAVWREMLQAKLGTYIGTDNKRFTVDRCDNALQQVIEAWQPLLPPTFQDDQTEQMITMVTWPSGSVSEGLDENVARLVGVDIPGYTVELYGIGRAGMDYNAWVDNKQRPNLANAGVFLLCLVGKQLLIHPTPTTDLSNVHYVARVYPGFPASSTDVIRVPSTTIPFYLAQAASIGKWGDLRATEAQALQQEALAMLQMIYGVTEREEQKS